nr:glycosyltransferase [Ruegeria sp. HKCCD6604]
MGLQKQVIGPLSTNIATAAYPGLRELITLDDSLRHVVANPFVLCVGTIEARKNAWRIAMAWKALLDQGYVNLPKLVFAGRRGWLRQDFEDLLEATGNVYGYVRVIDGPSDEELDMLYSHCQFSIMASLYEGWGLPVGEALAYGKTAVVANNSSLPEVGEDLVEYCDATEVSSIAEAVKRLMDDDHRAALEAKITAANLRDWADVARDLHAAIGLFS